jgi:lysophospholipase L1-like esterase
MIRTGGLLPVLALCAVTAGVETRGAPLQDEGDFAARTPAFAALHDRIESGAPITVVYLGGSITQGAMTYPQHGVNANGDSYDYRGRSDPERDSWRALTFRALCEAYEQKPGQFRMVNAAIGATDSLLASYRLEHQVLPLEPDLVFIEFAVNDNGIAGYSADPYADRSLFRTLSSIVTRLRDGNPDVALVMPVSTWRNLDMNGDAAPQQARRYHIQLANRLQVPWVDIHKAFYTDPLPEGAARDRVFDGPAEPGCAVHPSPVGHRVYAVAVTACLETLLSTARFRFTGPPGPAFPPYPESPVFVPAGRIPPPSAEWTHRTNTAFPNANHVLHDTPVLFTTSGDAVLHFTSRSQTLFLWAQHAFPGEGTITGRVEVWIDGERHRTFVDGEHRTDPRTTALLQRMCPVAHDLHDALHRFEIRVSPPTEGERVLFAIVGLGLNAPVLDWGSGTD